MNKAASLYKAVMLLSHTIALPGGPYCSDTNKAISRYKAVTTGELHSFPGMNKAASLYKAVILPFGTTAVLLGDPYRSGTNKAVSRYKAVTTGEFHSFPGMIKAASLYTAVILPSGTTAALLGDPHRSANSASTAAAAVLLRCTAILLGWHRLSARACCSCRR